MNRLKIVKRFVIVLSLFAITLYLPVIAFSEPASTFIIEEVNQPTEVPENKELAEEKEVVEKKELPEEQKDLVEKVDLVEKKLVEEKELPGEKKILEEKLGQQKEKLQEEKVVLEKKELPDEKMGLKELPEEKVRLEKKVLPEEKKVPEKEEVLEKKDKVELEKIVEKKDESLSIMPTKMDGMLIGSSIAILYAYLEYSNAKNASNKMKEEEYKMNTAVTYAEARYHQGKAEGYSDRVDYHYQNTTIGVVIAAGIFAWKTWKWINRTEVSSILFHPPTAHNETTTLSWNYQF